MPARAKAESPDTYRSVPYRTKANGVAGEQLNRADILALKTLLPAVLSRVGRLDPILSSAIQQGVQDAIDQVEDMIAAARRTETRDRCTDALASIRRFRAVVLPT
jgi:hypothetical protein